MSINSIKPIEPKHKTEPQTVKFRAIRETTRIERKYDPKEIFIEKAGQKINLYDFVQESSKDLEIYEVLTKYGQEAGTEILNKNKSSVTGDMTGAPKDLREIYDMKKDAEAAEERIKKVLYKNAKKEEKKIETAELNKSVTKEISKEIKTEENKK